jgi:hypothetical protein
MTIEIQVRHRSNRQAEVQVQQELSLKRPAAYGVLLQSQGRRIDNLVSEENESQEVNGAKEKVMMVKGDR